MYNCRFSVTQPLNAWFEMKAGTGVICSYTYIYALSYQSAFEHIDQFCLGLYSEGRAAFHSESLHCLSTLDRLL